MNKKLVALTFDDGPSNITSSILDILENEGIRGSFFLIGNNITDDKKYILERQVKGNHELCNHSLTHSDMTTLSKEEIVDEINETSRRIMEASGKTPLFFRPPYISVNETMYENINLPFICGLDSLDWDSNVLAPDRVSNVINGIKDGTIVLMHDLENNMETVIALPIIIQKLKEMDYKFVTVSELFELKNINPKVSNKIWSYV